MSKFTPRLWLLCGKDRLEISAYSPGKSKKDIEAGQSYYVPLVKMAYGDWQGKDWFVSKEGYQANAQAIAELVEACQEAYHIIKSSQYQRALLQGTIRLERIKEVEKQLKQALAKVEGK